MSKINFPGNPNNGASHRWKKRRRFNYSSSKGGWQSTGATPPAPSAPTLNNNTDLKDMNDATGLAAKMRGMAVMYNSYSDFPTEDIYTGSFAYARDTNELYVWTGASPVAVPLIGAFTSNRIDTTSTDLFLNSANNKSRIRTVMLNDNRFITAWVDDNFVQRAIGGKISGETVTIGEPIEINPGKTGASLSLATDGEVAVCIYEDRYPYYSIDHGSTEEKALERWSFARVISFTTADGTTLTRGSTIQTCDNPNDNTPNRGRTPEVQWAGGNNWVWVSGRFSRVGSGQQIYLNYGSFTRSGSTLTASRASTNMVTEPLNSWTFSEFDPVNNKLLLAYRVSSGQYRTQLLTVTPSTGNVSAGGINNPDTAISQTGITMDNVDIPYDASLGKWVYVYNRNGVYLLTIDGSAYTETWGTEHNILSSGTVTSPAGRTSAYYHADSGTVRIFCRTNSNADLGLLPITVNSTTTVSFDLSEVFTVETGGGSGATTVTYNATAGGGVAYKYDSGIKVAAFIQP